MTQMLVVLLCSVSLFAQAPVRTKRTVTDEEVARVHASTILIDTHNDITGRTVAGADILTRALLEEGYSQDDIIKIYGGNTLRLMTEVERAAAALQTSK